MFCGFGANPLAHVSLRFPEPSTQWKCPWQIAQVKEPMPLERLGSTQEIVVNSLGGFSSIWAAVLKDRQGIRDPRARTLSSTEAWEPRSGTAPFGGGGIILILTEK